MRSMGGTSSVFRPFFILIALLSLSSGTETTGIAILRTIHHDEGCFTQGLTYAVGTLYESCGLYGKSVIRIVDPNTGQVIVSKKVGKKYFAEGIVVQGNRVYMLTWKRKTMFVYDATSLDSIGNMTFQTSNGQGWGITSDGSHFIASDGSSVLTYFAIPKDSDKALAVAKHLTVLDGVTEQPVVQINELEYVDGFIYANLWYQDTIVKIDPATGRVVHRFDLSGLYPRGQRTRTADCLNGIAFDARDGSFLLTGKLWPHYYKVDLLGAPAQAQAVLPSNIPVPVGSDPPSARSRRHHQRQHSSGRLLTAGGGGDRVGDADTAVGEPLPPGECTSLP